VKYLLDTHVFLWALLEPEKLSSWARAAIENIDNTIVVSAVCGWEIMVKSSLGKLKLSMPPAKFITEGVDGMGLKTLDLRLAHTFLLPKLPDIHRDPFDRMLICQSQSEGIALITQDANISRYSVETFW